MMSNILFLSDLFIKVEEMFRVMDSKIWGIIISVCLIAALLLFLRSTKGSGKDQIVKHYFYFYLAIIFAAVALVITLITQNIF